MFTGIIASLGVVVDVAPTRLVIDAPGIAEELGASIAIDGCCLTVVSSEAAPVDLPTTPDSEPIATSRVAFDILPETVAHTRIREYVPGTAINLEPAVRAGQPLGGHLVQGHVDAVGTVRRAAVASDGIALDVELDVPPEVLELCIERGSITVNGTSLTIMALDGAGVRLQLIPETQQRTNLGQAVEGGSVNLEADVIARYVARLLAPNR
jgi:riboflavin synthase alpha subunit